jgi:hypothetical protein
MNKKFLITAVDLPPSCAQLLLALYKKIIQSCMITEKETILERGKWTPEKSSVCQSITVAPSFGYS